MPASHVAALRPLALRWSGCPAAVRGIASTSAFDKPELDLHVPHAKAAGSPRGILAPGRPNQRQPPSIKAEPMLVPCITLSITISSSIKTNQIKLS